MLRLLHTADVHLGARHADLGEQAAAQRERQFAAFKAAVDLAIAEPVDIVLIAGDLFDSNTQPRRSVERVAAELKRLVAARIRTVVIPGTHDVYDRASLYRVHDLAAMAGSTVDDDLVTVLTPDRPSVHLTACDVVIHGPVFATKRAPYSPLRDLKVTPGEVATWNVGMVHGSLAIPDRTDRDEVVVTRAEIEATGLDYLALGHWHSAQQGKAGSTTYAYSGAPEPVAVTQDGAGKILLIALDEVAGVRSVTVEERTVGRTRFAKLDVDASTLADQPELVKLLAARADPDLVLDTRLTGVRPDELDVSTDEVEDQLKGSFLKVRVRDASVPALTKGNLPSPDTIPGAFIRDVEGRIAELEAEGSETAIGEAMELRDVLRLGRLLLAGHEVTL
ncbi:MAG: repair protein SbcD/Mre11 [Chloroflexota bacterium]|jgi:DNA repair exonuclease SbcCD nuclease subunit|nr:repair protein SbcD/Mre11 [Chloroflexota bacterium]